MGLVYTHSTLREMKTVISDDLRLRESEGPTPQHIGMAPVGCAPGLGLLPFIIIGVLMVVVLVPLWPVWIALYLRSRWHDRPN